MTIKYIDILEGIGYSPEDAQAISGDIKDTIQIKRLMQTMIDA
ncbi:MAG: hypothetical protein Q9M26_04515 [Mariprofundales bacterium]|nr:hypothetical protein [Mariprofundales bacterium]